jgi:hypothetical protein
VTTETVVGFDVYGAGGQVVVPSADLVPTAVDGLPLHAVRREPRDDDRRFAVEIAGDGAYEVVDGAQVVARVSDLYGALFLLRRQVFNYAIRQARDHLVVSAGVVGVGGRAIVLPGPTRVGKTQLVAALLRAGAIYYTDDWAVLDREGLAHPHPVPLLMRGEGYFTPERLGAVRGDTPIPVAVIALVTYAEGGAWRVEGRTPGQGALMLMQASYGMEVPQTAVKIAHTAAASALVLEGERGEADDAAAALMNFAAQASSEASS